MITKIAIYDMDGTTVDSTHRYRTIDCPVKGARIDLEYWRANEHRAYDDSLLPLAAQYQADLRDESVFVVIATARILNGPDFAFICDKLGIPDHIISRKHGDTRSGGLLKVMGLRRLLNLKQFSTIEDIVFYEDNVDYLKIVCDTFGIRGVYIPSKQGH